MSSQLVMEFSRPLVVHCFLPTCNHTVSGFDYEDNHDRMEAHYSSRHGELIRKLAGS